jgi:hypothetical protein
MSQYIKTYIVAAIVFLAGITSAMAEPISLSIGLTAAIAGITGEAVALGTFASVIGGSALGLAVSLRLRFRR